MSLVNVVNMVRVRHCIAYVVCRVVCRWCVIRVEATRKWIIGDQESGQFKIRNGWKVTLKNDVTQQ